MTIKLDEKTFGKHYVSLQLVETNYDPDYESDCCDDLDDREFGPIAFFMESCDEEGEFDIYINIGIRQELCKYMFNVPLKKLVGAGSTGGLSKYLRDLADAMDGLK